MNFELSEIGAKVRDANVSKKIAEKFRKNRDERENAQMKAISKRVYGFACFAVLLIIFGFIIGWFSSITHHTPTSETVPETTERTDQGEPQELGHMEPGSKCQNEGEQFKGHTCRLVKTCTNGVIVESQCPKFHIFDTKTSSCQWVHQAQCDEGEAKSDVVHIDDALPGQLDAGDAEVEEEEDEVNYGGVAPNKQQVHDTEVRILMKHGISRVRKDLRTLPNSEVELIRPNRQENPQNVKILESILKEKHWDFIFPVRNVKYTYRGFLQAAGKFPAFCGSPDVCKLSLAVVFSHFAQETGAHDSSMNYPEWRQGLYYLEEAGCTNRDCGYSSNCRQADSWLVKTWPCQNDARGRLNSYHGRGAKQISYNYNYGQFSTFMYGDPIPLLKNPELVSNTWLSLASAIWFFLMPQPPKPSMLEVVDGTWIPNSYDVQNKLSVGFGVTTHIINGGVECGKGKELAQSKNRQEYFRSFAAEFGVSGWGGDTGCSNMGEFPSKGSGSQLIFWEQDWARRYRCKLVAYQTSFSALVEGDYQKCVEEKFNVEIV